MPDSGGAVGRWVVPQFVVVRDVCGSRRKNLRGGRSDNTGLGMRPLDGAGVGRLPGDDQTCAGRRGGNAGEEPIVASGVTVVALL